MTVIALGVLFFYVHPTFTNIGKIQESILLYQTEISKVKEVNEKLANLTQRLNVMSQSDISNLMTYLPDTVDHMAVSADILNMAVEADVFLESIRSNEGVNSTLSSEPTIKHTFGLSITGTYENIKAFLAKLEENNYPLETHNFVLSASETDLMKATLSVVTYSFNNSI
jgi:Tfp pilus assembly protein PilO